MAFSPRRWRRRLVAVAFGIVLGFLVMDVAVRLGGYDWELIEQILYYQNADLLSQRMVDDPQLIYRLRPGQHHYRQTPHSQVGYTVTVNSLGARGAEIAAEKPPQVFRVVTLGGSNVYGLGLSDEDTWPAQLEQVLDRDYDGDFEVVNFGAPAYVPQQMVALGREALEKLDPDVILFGLSNLGPPPFVQGEPVAPYFRRDGELYEGLLSKDCPPPPRILPRGVLLTALRHSALARFFHARHLVEAECDWNGNYDLEERNIRLAREFFADSAARGVPVVVFLFPGYARNAFDYNRYTVDTSVPVLTLEAEDRGPEYRNIHPPKYVFTWYAQSIAAWLAGRGLLD
ncbi:MAG: SGNH/GDSL hydrolase family protein [Candidatus Lernaella stagnicola]|nr:SGNH/GDSL hydrolase family protein [Candidatus Lernaella stagnicola]